MPASIALFLASFLVAWGAAAQTPAAAAAANASNGIFKGKDGFNLAPRNALVIGVPSVQGAGNFDSLKNPGNDARQVTKALREVGFSVIALHESYEPHEITRQIVKRALYDFTEALRLMGGVGLIYFSGHGIEQGGNMYVVPYDAYIRYGRDLTEELIPVSLFYEAFRKAGNNTNILVIDACRNNPWNRPPEAFYTRDPDRAESLLKEWPTVIKATATLSGRKAADGSQAEVSPYAKAFIATIAESDRSLTQFFFDGVNSRTESELGSTEDAAQVPSVSFAGTRDFVFHPTEVSFNRELAMWNNARRDGNRDRYVELTTKYAGGYFYKAAKRILDTGNFAPEAARGEIVEVREATVLRTAPNPTAAGTTIAAGTRLLAAAPQAGAEQDARWVSIQGARSGYVPRGATKETSISTTEVSIGLTDGTLPGTYVISAEAQKAIEAAAGAARGSPLTTMEVVGLVYKGDMSPEHAMLARRVKVLDALRDAGADTSSALLSVRPADEQSPASSVKVVVKAALPR